MHIEYDAVERCLKICFGETEPSGTQILHMGPEADVVVGVVSGPVTTLLNVEHTTGCLLVHGV